MGRAEEIKRRKRGRSKVSKQFIEFSYSYLYASDIQASIKWFQKICGFLVLDVTPEYAVMETTPGQILYLSKDPDSSIEFTILATEQNIKLLKHHLIDNKIEMEFDFPHWLVFRDPDHNMIEVWAANVEVDYIIQDKVVHETIRYYLESKEQLHFLIRSIADYNEYETATEALKQECRKSGIVPQGDAVRLAMFSKQIDANYIGIPLLSKPSKSLPNESEYIVIPAQEYTVYPIHKSVWADQRTTQLVDRIRHSSSVLSRPEQFYIVEHDIDEDYVEAFIPYVWRDIDANDNKLR
jgi:hypothetical protein